MTEETKKKLYWRTWIGAEHENPPTGMVSVLKRDRTVFVGPAGSADWNHTGGAGDIIGWHPFKIGDPCPELLPAPDYDPAEVAFKADGPNPLYHLTVPGYGSLADVLRQAYAQAASGKGAERHAQGQPFDRQPMQNLIALHGVGFATGQASKKAQESHRLPRDAAVRELLGAINYLAGAVIAIESGITHHTD